MDKTSLGDRMKGYENITRNKLMRRTPVIIRIDGKAFHTYTKGCEKPFDEDLHNIRKLTMEYLVDNIQGCILGYSQSDEISLLLKDWQTLQTDAWFDNNIQKMVSISASMCTAKWNEEARNVAVFDVAVFDNKLAMFDSRAWNLPKEEVVNYLIWRQQDWTRNSIQMLAQSIYSHKELQGLSCSKLITKVEEDYGIIWGDLKDWEKRGEFYMKPHHYFRGVTPRFQNPLTRLTIEQELNDET